MNSWSGIVERTFLIERVVSLSVYVLALFITYYYIKKAKSYSEIRRSLNLYLVILTMMGFFFVPDASKDLTRILRNTEYWKTISIKDLARLELPRTSAPIGQIYIYLCRKTQIDGFLPACTAFLFFSNVFHILKKSYQKLGYSSESVAMSLLLFMSSGCFLEVISDIRCFLAFSIVARFIFDEICMGKSIIKSLPFYLLAALIHISVFPIIAIRILFYLGFESRRRTSIRLITSVIVIGASIVAFVLFRDLIDAVFSKANSYLSGGHYSYVWEYIIGAAFWLVLIYILKKHRKMIDSRNSEYRSESSDLLYKLSVILLMVEAVFCFEYNMFHRYILMSLFVAMPLLSDTVTLLAKEQSVFKRNIFALSFLILAFVCMRGNLCGYKFFVL